MAALFERYNGANEDALNICGGCDQDTMNLIKETSLGNNLFKLHLKCIACLRNAFPIVQESKLKALKEAIRKRQERENQIGELFHSVDEILVEAFPIILDEVQQNRAAFEEYYRKRNSQPGVEP